MRLLSKRICVLFVLASVFFRPHQSWSDGAADYTEFLKKIEELNDDDFIDILIEESRRYVQHFSEAPNVADVHINLADIYAREKKRTESFVTYLEVAHLYSNSETVSIAQDQVRALMMQENDFEPLRERIEEIINPSPTDSTLEARHYALIRKLYYLNFDRISTPLVSSCQLYLNNFPTSRNQAEVRFWMAELLAKDDEEVQALAEYLKVASLYKGSVFESASLLKVADLQTDEFKMHQRAIMTLDAFVERFPDDPQAAQAQFRKGQIIEKETKKYIEAIDAYQAVAQKYPKSLEAVPALFEVSRIYASKLKEYNKAIEVYATVVRDFKEDLKAPYALTESARIYEDKLKDYVNAANIYYRVYELYPESSIAAECLYASAEINEKKVKNNENALAHYRLVVDKYPTSRVAEKASKRIQKLSEQNSN